MLKTLWLASWYPNEEQLQNGDFIQRHAWSVAVYADVHVIHVFHAKKDSYALIKNGRLTEEVVLYKKENSSVKWKIISCYKYFSLYKKYVEAYIKVKGLPDIVHVHVPIKAGIIALWLKRKYKIPYVVTEHFGIYNTYRKDNYTTKNKLFKQATKLVLKHADCFLPVSYALGIGVNKMVISKPFTKIPNVVNTEVFNFKEEKQDVFTFIHVSSLDKNKNPEGIIRAYSELLKINDNVCLKMIGGNDSMLCSLSETLKIPSCKIVFKGQLSNEMIAEEIKNAHTFVLFSYSENLPCVIAESLCCGVPVIAANVGGIGEMLDDSNGILINSGNEQDLLSAMKSMMENYQNYDREKIAFHAQQIYNYNVVAQQIMEAYRKVLTE